MIKKSLPLSQVYRLIEPGPVVMVNRSFVKRASLGTDVASVGAWRLLTPQSHKHSSND
jgi:hypothetical protein